jgi:S1-C subfamily serine protease
MNDRYDSDPTWSTEPPTSATPHVPQMPYAPETPYAPQTPQTPHPSDAPHAAPGPHASEAPFAPETPYPTAYMAAPPFPPAPDSKPSGTNHRRRWLIVGGIATAVAVAGVAIGVGSGNSVTTGSGASGNSQLAVPPSAGSGGNGSGSGGSGSDGSGSDQNPWGGLFGGLGNGGNGSQGNGNGGGYGNGGGSGNGSGGSTGTASADQQVGVVDIDTVLGYQSARAAGTGMVLTSNGEILTNNHVVRGATSITVTVVSTGKTYKASVVGTDPTEDVAVLQLSDASGLQTAHLASSNVSVGDAVTAVGNAGGTGGTPSAAPGQVTALDQTITATDDNGSNAEQLNGLIETNANVQAGDSGGPLYNDNNQVVGMDTAAGSSSPIQTATEQAYAIPIGTALKIADQIEGGQASSTIHIGNPAFLGIELSNDQFSAGSNGAAIAGVIDGTPAAQAGLAAGDVITGVDNTQVSSSTDLSTALASHKAGDSVRISWTDQSGQSHSANVTLIAGPAD